MTHYFNVCEVEGEKIEPVDIITFGSPCQDMSIAGKRAGLKHTDNGDEETTRSGLFMEAVRIIKEMRSADKLRNQWLPDTKNRNGSNADSESGTARERGNDSIRTSDASSTDNTKGGTTNIEKPITQYGFCSTDNLRPRFAVWENVPGAFSSNKGEDFRIVLEELAKVKEPSVSIPKPKDGKWLAPGQIVGNGYSIAWRTLDAQFWGVPQRRRRIYLVADFGGESAGKVLFESESLSRHFEQSKTQRERIAGNVEGGIRKAIGFVNRGHNTGKDLSETIRSECHGDTPLVAYQEPLTYSGENVTSPHNKQTPTPGVCHTLDQDSRNYVVQLCGDRDNPSVSWSDKAYCLPANPMSDRGQAVVQPASLCFEPGAVARNMGNRIWEKKSPTLRADAGDNQPAVFTPTYCLQGNGIDRADTAGCNGKGWSEEVCYTLNTIDRPAVATGINGEVAGTLDASYYKGTGMRNGIEREVVFAMQRSDEFKESQVASTQSARQYKDSTDLIASVDCRNGTENTDVNGTLQAKESGGISINLNNTIRNNMTVRRLTPTECARLQGFPDEWGKLTKITEMSDEDYQFWTECRKVKAMIDGKKFQPKTKEQTIKWYNKLHTDSAEYKMWGNGIALPCADYVLSGLANEGAKTLGSLFDGSGGFPLAGILNGINPLWSSEIEPYPIAVTKSRIYKIEREER